MGELLIMVVVPPLVGLVAYAVVRLLRRNDEDLENGGDRSAPAFIVACISAAIIAIIAGFVLNIIQEPVDKAFTSSAVRLGT